MRVPQLVSLSLAGVENVNVITIKEIGKACKSLTKLDLCAGSKKHGFGEHGAGEMALIEAVETMPKLKLLRVPPFSSARHTSHPPRPTSPAEPRVRSPVVNSVRLVPRRLELRGRLIFMCARPQTSLVATT